PTKLTTQQPDYLNVFFDACVKKNIEWVVMEVAAQAFSLHRVDGLCFDMAIFTNFSQEHGEFYQSMEEYFSAKAKIIEHLKSGAPLLVNADDDRAMSLGENYDDTYCFAPTLYTCPALIGVFNQYNIAAAVTAADHIGIS